MNNTTEFSHGWTVLHYSRVILPTVPRNLCQHLVLCQRIVLNQPPGCFSARFYCLNVESPPWRAGRQFTLGNTHTFTYPDLLSFLQNLFIAKEIYLLFLIEFYVNRLNDFDVLWPCWCDLQTSRPQASSYDNSSARQQRVLNNSKKSFTFKMS